MHLGRKDSPRKSSPASVGMVPERRLPLMALRERAGERERGEKGESEWGRERVGVCGGEREGCWALRDVERLSLGTHSQFL